jgi:hypothetical protein
VRDCFRRAGLATTLVLAIALVVASASPGRAAPTEAGSRPRVVLFGDSMLSESSAAVRQSLRALKPGWDVEVRAFPGTGICNWLDEMQATDAQAVALLFTGVVFTDCILNRRKWPEAYFFDAASAASIFRAKGTEVIWLGWPRPARDVLSPHLDDTIWHYYEQVADEFGERVADPGMALFDPARGRYPMTMPCLTASEPGCVHGRVRVRDARGGHLCPLTDLSGPCPVYSSGVRRYALAAARDVADALPHIPV